MKVIAILLLVGVALHGQEVCTAATIVEANRTAEVSFTSLKDYADPFAGVTLDAIFTTPDGRLLRVPAFWAGGKTWRVRYASAQTGTHRFRTECNDTANAALHGVTGEIEVKPYAGDNPLFRHGALRIADDRRHFAHADGTPFFWLGDTWWMGFTARLRWPEDFQTLAADRRAKGFTVIQIVAGLYPDMPAFDERGLGDGGFPWEPLYARIRPEYFDAADRRIEHLVEQGLMPCVLGCWGYHLPWLGTERMKQHWRYLIARWGALPVVWCASGEQAMAWYNSGNKPPETEQLRREWTEVIRFIHGTDPFDRLVTTHPRRNARDEVIDPTVVDFEMQQTGHGSPTPQHAARALEAWNRPPLMPVMCGESRYEGLDVPTAWPKPGEVRKEPIEYLSLRAREAREAFWAHLLNSGCAGHTYGANGIWQVNLPDRRFGASPGGHDWGATPWREAMNQPGSTQLAHAKRFLLTLPWNQLAPATDVFTGATSAAATPDGRCALAFATGGTSVKTDLSRLRGPLRARWYDPTSGELKAVEDLPLAAGGGSELTPPGLNSAGETDWVLVLEPRL
jgi:hypothetical protein